MRRPSNGPPWRWKYHHGMPFCIGTMTVSSWQQVMQILHDGRDLMRLHAEDHDILRSGLGQARGRLDARRDAVGAVGHPEPHAARPDRLQVRAARDERDVLARQRELDADVAADRTGADDAEFHRRFPLVCAAVRPPESHGADNYQTCCDAAMALIKVAIALTPPGGGRKIPPLQSASGDVAQLVRARHS